MTEEEYKEFENISNQVNTQRADAHAKFLIYSDAQRKLDQLINKQSELFHKLLNWTNGSVK